MRSERLRKIYLNHCKDGILYLIANETLYQLSYDPDQWLEIISKLSPRKLKASVVALADK